MKTQRGLITPSQTHIHSYNRFEQVFLLNDITANRCYSRAVAPCPLMSEEQLKALI